MSAPILMSACLLGEPCRYDGKSVPCAQAIAFAQAHDIVPICPEQFGGLSTPRVPCEIMADGRVVDAEGVDRSAAFELGARGAVKIACERGCKTAILKSRSPSCGVREVYDGSFTRTLVLGEGKTTAALRSVGIKLYDELNAPWDEMRE